MRDEGAPPLPPPLRPLPHHSTRTGRPSSHSPRLTQSQSVAPPPPLPSLRLGFEGLVQPNHHGWGARTDRLQRSR